MTAILSLPRELINLQNRFFSRPRMTEVIQPKRERLQAHFDVPLQQYSQQWEALWQQGELLLWDKGKPSPALIDALAARRDLLGPPVVNGKRKRALVPGCGRGYDVLLLASFGYDAYGVDVSQSAIDRCQDFAKGEFKSYSEHASEWGCGGYKFMKGDFFSNEWRKSMLDSADGEFDLIYDYTFLCALPPDMRPDWALRMLQLLSPEGRLVCLEFPTWKNPAQPGPPYGLQPEFYVAHLSRPGVHLAYNSEGYLEKDPESDDELDLESAKSVQKLQRIAHFQAERTHDYGIENNVDWVSIWKHA